MGRSRPSLVYIIASNYPPLRAFKYQTLPPLITFTQSGSETSSVVRLILGLIGVASPCVVLPPVSCSLLYHDPASPGGET